MAKNESNAQWVEIDPATLDESLRTPYELYKEAAREAAKLRTAFEQDMNDAAALPEGKRMVFGYRFGKLSAAIVDDDRKPVKAQPAKLTLSQFIASQAASGHRV